MSGVRQKDRLARAVDLVSAGLFAGASGYSALLLASPAVSGATAILAFVGALNLLGRIDDQAPFALHAFAVGEVEVLEDELLLADLTELLLTDRWGAEDNTLELLLDDPLAVPSEDSRVIRLFDPRSMPTEGGLHERITGHLRELKDTSIFPDATTGLHHALSALRGSLR